MKFIKLEVINGVDPKDNPTRWFDPTAIYMISPASYGEFVTCILHLGHDKGGMWEVRGNPEAVAQLIEIARRS